LDLGTGCDSPRPMPDVLNALVAFVAERQRCGDLDGGRDDGKVWLACSCGAQIVHPATPPPPNTGTNVTRPSRQRQRDDLLRVSVSCGQVHTSEW